MLIMADPDDLSLLYFQDTVTHQNLNKIQPDWAVYPSFFPNYCLNMD